MSRPGSLATVIAHRGASTDAPENTLAALALAAAQGATCVEIDVAISSDQVPFLHHDDDLARCTTGTGRLCDHLATSIDQLNAARLFPAFGHEPVPRLTAAIELLRTHQLALNLEVKPVAGLEVLTARAIARVIASDWPAAQPLVISSFSTQALGEVQARLPAVPRALISHTVPDDIDALAERFALCNLHCAGEQVRADDIRRLHTLGLGVYCYTVNDEVTAKALLAMGVDGLFTDQPDLLLASLPDATG